ncbi:MAG: chemotaxis protein CheA [Thermodesulfovibrionales bacterium]|nr:chemotaxis protein CheA [Thermodesulfovibrionales bacterium]
MDYSALIKDYIDDANVHIGAFDAALMALERDGLDRDLIQNTLGSLHTLKGNSGMMGFESLKTYIHQVEGILKAVVEEKLPLEGVMETLLDSANIIRDALSHLEEHPSNHPDLAEGILSLKNAAEGNGKDAGQKTLSLKAYMGSKTDTIKVDFKRLDDLLNMVGELVIFKTRMNQIEERIKPVLASKPLIHELHEGLQLIGKTVSELQEGIMKIRMLPVKVVFSKFPRMVMDIARSQGKQVVLSFEGEDTELDKTVIDELGEPLLHIIRNAIDHGIETPAERINKGKSPEGKIILSASQESNYVIIRVRDDGRGIDPEKIRRKAIERGLSSEDALPGREDLMSFIFMPGFTTKEETSDISGRGIGLDVVSRNISRLNGQTTVESVSGKGSVFTIKLPLSLAIIPALMAESSGEIYAIPMSSVDESVKVKESDIHMVNNREVIRLRDQVLPVVRMNRFFNLGGAKRKKFYLVVVRKAEKRLALAVDGLRGQQEIVIKPLDDTFGKSAGIVGASILGNGKIVLIIDALAFWSGNGLAKDSGAGQQKAPEGERS